MGRFTATSEVNTCQNKIKGSPNAEAMGRRANKIPFIRAMCSQKHNQVQNASILYFLKCLQNASTHNAYKISSEVKQRS